MQDLTISLVQFNVKWQNPIANRKIITGKIETLKIKPDLIVLPEMFTTGFTMEVKSNAEQPEGETLIWMKSMASSTGATITGSIIIIEDNKYYNRLLWVKPNGDYSYYDKRHLFRMADESNYFTDGNESPIFEINGWKVKPMICYDLRFPVWSRNINLEYDIIMYVANWPQARINAWNILLKARAIENLSYSIGLNRIGVDGGGKKYNGHSGCYNYKGDIISNLSEKEEVIDVTLSKSELEDYRKSFPANLDADKFNIHNLT